MSGRTKISRYVIANKEQFEHDGCANLISDRSTFSLYWAKSLHTLCKENVLRKFIISPLIVLCLLFCYFVI